MPGAFQRVKDIFLVAVEKTGPGELEEYLRDACGGDAALRRRVEALLRREGQAGGFLEAPAFHATSLPDPVAVAAETAGTRAGPYTLLEPIGEGGMGTVWMAEQEQPIRRKVALKLIKPGMDSRHVVARFEAERQALALMDHPNIARVFDGGSTDAGRPYFVMELVQGTPITRACDELRLTLRQRLELFVPVCQAVQHAHQKGIIHRDLKPSNVLVARYDGKLVPKVIDFGVAKATGQSLTDKTFATGIGNIVGTLEYMSPEQAEVDPLDIDTRSDIYALGVLLYELLVGSPPFSRKQLERAGVLEMLRVIREQEPSRPSTKLSTAEGLPALATNRGTEPSRLTKLVRGELDWIVMKALEKDRNRRYETADGFAADVGRYMADQPVLAAPPTVGYRCRKFARRNRRAIVSAGVIGCAILLTFAAIGWAVSDRAARVEHARQAEVARRARVGGQLQVILDDVTRLEREMRWSEALDAARRAADLLAGGDVDPEPAKRVHETVRDLELVRVVEGIRAGTSEWKARSFDYRGAAERYSAAFRKDSLDFDHLTVEESASRLLAKQSVVAALLPIVHDWAGCRYRTGDKAGAEHLWNVVARVEPDPWRLKVRQARLNADVQAVLTLAAAPDLDRHPAAALTDVAQFLSGSGRVDAAIEVLLVARREHPTDFWVHFELGSAFDRKGPTHLEEAAGCYRTAVALRPRNTAAWNNLASVLREQRKLGDAVACFQKSVDLDPTHAVAQSNLGLVLQDQGKLDEAIACHKKAIDIDPGFPGAQNNLGLALHAQNRLPEAVAAFNRALHLDPQYAVAYHNLGGVLRDQQQPSDAITAYRKAIELNPRYARAYFNLGLTLVTQKQLPEAAAAYQKAVEFDPLFAEAFNNLGLVRREQNDLPGAISLFRSAVAINPKLAPAHNNLGLALQAQNDLRGAVAAYKQAAALAPTNPVIRDNYRMAVDLQSKAARACYEEGKALSGQSKLPEACAAFQKALEFDPMFAPAHRDLGIIRHNQNRLDEAIAHLRTSTELDARDVNALLMLGNSLGRKGMLDEAGAAYRGVIRVLPDNGTAQNNWARLLVTHPDPKRRNPTEAVKLANRAVEIDPKRGDWWHTLGIARYRAGAWKDAVAAMDRSMELTRGGDPRDWFFVAMAYWRLDQKDEARRWYDRAARWQTTNGGVGDSLLIGMEAARLLGVEGKKD